MKKIKKEKIFTEKAVFDFMEAYEKRLGELNNQVSISNQIAQSKDYDFHQCNIKLREMTDRYNKICVDTNRYLQEVQMLKQTAESYRQSIETIYKPAISNFHVVVGDLNKKIEELKLKIIS